MIKKVNEKWLRTLAALVVSGMLLGLMVVPAFAMVDEDVNVISSRNVDGDGVRKFFEGVLTRTFRYQSSMTEFIGDALENAERSLERAEAKIDTLIEEGKDTTVLEEAIELFEDLFAEAENAYNAAQSLVDLHSGFDDDGKIDDLASARETISAIEPHLRTARESIVEAIRVIYEAIQTYQLENVE